MDSTQAAPSPHGPVETPGRPARRVAVPTILAGVLVVSTFALVLTMKSPKVNVMVSGDTAAIVRGNSAFALDFYQQVRGTEGNLFFSPYSLSMGLAMAYAGARGNTQQQMAKVLHFPLEQAQLHPTLAGLQADLDQMQQTGHITIHSANSLWIQEGYPLLDDYLSLAKTSYGTSVTPLDFRDQERACKRINQWVEQMTASKIKDVLDPGTLDPGTTLALINAIYFKGNWQDQFTPQLTDDAPFHVTPSQSVQVPMMTQTKKVRYGEMRSLQILELPYVGGDLSMLLLLPEKANGLDELETSFTTESLGKWRASLREVKVRIFLPKFTFTFCLRVDDILKSMGMPDAFSLPPADFTGMTGKADLYINAAIHKAYVEVNEEGTEAAAVTFVAVGRARGSRSKEPPTFRADHPFLFLIQERRTGSILFIGRVINPTKS